MKKPKHVEELKETKQGKDQYDNVICQLVDTVNSLVDQVEYLKAELDKKENKRQIYGCMLPM